MYRDEKTLGDFSNTAATAGREQVDFQSIPFLAPKQWRADVPIGDRLAIVGGIAGVNSPGSIDYVVSPIEDPRICYNIYRLSPFLEPIVDAFNANVYAAGFSLPAVLDPDKPSAAEEIRRILAYERIAEEAGYSRPNFEKEVNVTDNDVELELGRLRRRIHNERQFVESFFVNAIMDMTYHRLMEYTGQDLEVCGVAYWEITRYISGLPATLSWVPGWSIRPKPQDPTVFFVLEPVRVSSIRWRPGYRMRRFRSYVQLDGFNQVVTRYKEFGDPRVMSPHTGRYFSTLQEMYNTENANTIVGTLLRPATELLSFNLPCGSSYTNGKPKWTGVFPGLEGARDLDEYNKSAVVDQVIPQLLLMISGGSSTKESIDSLKSQVREAVDNKEKGIYFVHAKSDRHGATGPSIAPTISVEKLKSDQIQDAYGLEYKKDAYASIRRAYRFPKIAFGDEEGVTGQKAASMLRFTESQVYDPKRVSLDDRINSTLMRDLGVQLISYKTSSRTPKEPTELTEILGKLTEAGIITPDEGRVIAGDIFNTEFKDIVGAWTKLPKALLTAILQTKNQIVAAAVLSDETDLAAKLHDALISEAQATRQGLLPASHMNPVAPKAPTDGKEPQADTGGVFGEGAGSGGPSD